MAKIAKETEFAVSISTVHGEEDLKPNPSKANINPPPGDGECQCCKRHLRDLKPYGKAGDPLVGDFEGALLVKTFIPDAPYLEEIDKIMTAYFYQGLSDAEAERRLVQTFGQETAEDIMVYASMQESVGPIWLCRDCIILDEDELLAKLWDCNMEKHRQWAKSLEQKLLLPDKGCPLSSLRRTCLAFMGM